MTLQELSQYAQFLNILMIPGLMWIIKLEKRLTFISVTMKAHADLDEEIVKGMRRDVSRIEESATAAHRRMDFAGLKPGGASG